MPYRVRVRNTDDGPRNTTGADNWPAYAKRAREAAVPKVTQSELARRMETDRSTVWRWEHGRQKPDTPDIVVRFADVLGLDREEALAAAGFRPDLAPPVSPKLDEEVELVLAAKVDEDTRREALEQLYRMQIRDRKRRMEDIEEFILRRRRA